MAESFYQYFLHVWMSPFRVHLVQAIYVAAIFELLVFLTNRRLRRALAGAVRRDTGREHSERIRRRRVVEGLPLLINRGLLYTVALLMIVRVLGLPTGAEVLPLLLAAVVVVLVVFRDPLRDAARGYYIMYDYLYAPGDRISVGELTGIVTELTLRVTRLRTTEGREVAIPNRRVTDVVNHSRGAAKKGRDESGQ
ncbi:MAG: mechanosensitive ion channel [Armatimonadetes bacterium]|nr:mechanosensitive ion channel [Armatimonadota bacterium]